MNLTHELIPNVEEFRTRNQPRAEHAARLLIGGLALNHFSIFCYSFWLIRSKGKPAGDLADGYTWIVGFWAVGLLALIVWACFRKSGRWHVNRVVWLCLTSCLSINAFVSWLKEHGIERAFPQWQRYSIVTTLLLLTVVAIPLELTFLDAAKRKMEETD
ncbi:MAG: hypothetical protein WCK51_01215 [Armatimonadota bacterium]